MCVKYASLQVYVQCVSICEAFGIPYSTWMKALVSVFSGIYYAIFPTCIALILLATLSLVLPVLHLPQLLYPVCVHMWVCCVSGRDKVKRSNCCNYFISALFPPIVLVLRKIWLLFEEFNTESSQHILSTFVVMKLSFSTVLWWSYVIRLIAVAAGTDSQTIASQKRKVRHVFIVELILPIKKKNVKK